MPFLPSLGCTEIIFCVKYLYMWLKILLQVDKIGTSSFEALVDTGSQCVSLYLIQAK